MERRQQEADLRADTPPTDFCWQSNGTFVLLKGTGQSRDRGKNMDGSGVLAWAVSASGEFNHPRGDG
jgi:hypothetical protein